MKCRFFFPALLPLLIAPLLHSQGTAAAPQQITQSAYLKSDQPTKNDYFGSVAISGDWAVVGAPFDGKKNTGAVFVYRRVEGKWVFNTELARETRAQQDDRFGFAVAIDGTTIVASSFTEDGSDTLVDSGTIYVFTYRPAADAVGETPAVTAAWTQQARLTADNAGAGDFFGYSVGISGDRIVVGAVGEASGSNEVDGKGAKNGALRAGAAYVFSRTSTRPTTGTPIFTWRQQAYLKASNSELGDFFGYSVGIHENQIIVGAPFHANKKGAAYIYDTSGAKWKQKAILKARKVQRGDQFGKAVAIYKSEAVVGAPFESSDARTIDGNAANNRAPKAGAVYIFRKNESGKKWEQKAYLKASNSGKGDLFGSSVAINGELLAVGAPNEDSKAKNSGAVYLFSGDSAKWVELTSLKASNAGARDHFGYSVGVADKKVFVGASGEASTNDKETNNGAPNAGAAYAFDVVDLLPEISIFENPDKSVTNGATISFPTINVDSKSPGEAQRFSIKNDGNVDLSITSIQLDGTEAGNFDLDKKSVPDIIAPGASSEFSVAFTPTVVSAPKDFTATLKITSNDSDESTFDIQLNGKVVTPPAGSGVVITSGISGSTLGSASQESIIQSITPKNRIVK
jgi:hypothetical protein